MQQTEAQHHPAPARAIRRRVLGVDIARGLAIIGMVMVHLGPQDASGGGVAGAIYRSSHGRASILFIVLAGIGVSMLAGDRSAPRLRRARHRLWWRGLILLPAGLALQALPTQVAVILQYYAVFFVVAALLLRLGDRVLLGVSAAGATIGPVVLVWLHRVAGAWFEPGVPAWDDAARIARDIAVTGYYPVITWVAPLAFGMWLGRRDLRSDGTALRMLAGGCAVAAAGFVVSDVAIALLGDPTSEGDWRSLAAIVAHNEMPLWIVTSGAIAVAITGACVLLGRRLPTLLWPLVAFGQLALTVYVLHLLVLARWPDLLVRDAIGPAWRVIAWFALVSVTLATLYRAVAPRGPFEVLLRLPWQGGLPGPADAVGSPAARDPAAPARDPAGSAGPPAARDPAEPPAPRDPASSAGPPAPRDPRGRR